MQLQLSGNNEASQNRSSFYLCVDRTHASPDEVKNKIFAIETSYFFLIFFLSVIIVIKVCLAN